MSQPEPAEDWLPTATVAAQLKVSERTVNRWANEGILPIAFQAPGATGARFFRAEDVRRLLRENPKVVGLSGPGMPQGSPGMETVTPKPYDTLLVRADGGYETFAKH